MKIYLSIFLTTPLLALTSTKSPSLKISVAYFVPTTQGVLNSLEIIAEFLIMFMMVSTVFNVILRNFGWGMLWSLEITEYSLVFIPFLGAAWLLQREGHISLDLLLERIAPRPRILLNIATSIVVAAVVLILTWYSAHATADSFQVGYLAPGMLRFPRYLLLLVIPVGSFLLFIQFIRRINKYIQELRSIQ